MLCNRRTVPTLLQAALTASLPAAARSAPSSRISQQLVSIFLEHVLLLLQVVQEAICPERRAGLDDKLSAVASVTHVYVSNDLQVRPGPHTCEETAVARCLTRVSSASVKSQSCDMTLVLCMCCASGCSGWMAFCSMFQCDRLCNSSPCCCCRCCCFYNSAVVAVGLLLLQVVKAYVSVYSDELGKERAISNLKRIAP
jgi:hypothetical protein